MEHTPHSVSARVQGSAVLICTIVRVSQLPYITCHVYIMTCSPREIA